MADSKSKGAAKNKIVNPFKGLPFPSPGEPIKADDFKKLSQSLMIISDAYKLSNDLFSLNFGEAKQVLAEKKYEILKVKGIFGTEIKDWDDKSMDSRKVIQALPVELGERSLAVILAEEVKEVETRSVAPNLIGLTCKEAKVRLRASLGDVKVPSTPVNAQKSEIKESKFLSQEE